MQVWPLNNPQEFTSLTLAFVDIHLKTVGAKDRLDNNAFRGDTQMWVRRCFFITSFSLVNDTLSLDV